MSRNAYHYDINSWIASGFIWVIPVSIIIFIELRCQKKKREKQSLSPYRKLRNNSQVAFNYEQDIFKTYNFSKDELLFFTAFSEALKILGYKHTSIHIEQYIKDEWIVEYSTTGLLGKICLDFTRPPPKYAVKKNGASRATRVFDAFEMAQSFITQKPEYIIEIREAPNRSYMYCHHDIGDPSIYQKDTVEEYVMHLEEWLQRIIDYERS